MLGVCQVLVGEERISAALKIFNVVKLFGMITIVVDIWYFAFVKLINLYNTKIDPNIN
jgi:hypothetical protein